MSSPMKSTTPKGKQNTSLDFNAESQRQSNMEQVYAQVSEMTTHLDKMVSKQNIRDG